MGRFTLTEFQQSGGILKEDTLVLAYNPAFYNTFFHCIDRRSIRSLAFRIMTGICGQPKREFYRIPDRNCILFLGFPKFGYSYDQLDDIEALFSRIGEKSQFQYTVLLGRGDYNVTSALLKLLPKNVAYLFANNVNINENRLFYFPVGRDFRNRHLFDSTRPCGEKRYLVYGNFSLNTHPIRETIYASVKDKDFIKFEHMGRFKAYTVPRETFMENLAASRFALCPRGRGLDTYRLWDSLYAGTIPIVVHDGAFSKELEDLPILFIERAEDYAALTREFLESTYERMLRMPWNYDKLKLSYWLSLVREKSRQRGIEAS